MTAAELLSALTNATFVLIFILVLIRAVRRPSRDTLDIALFFAAPAIAITQGWVVRTLGIPPSPTLSLISIALIMAIPLLTLRAIQRFTVIPTPVIVAAAVGWLVSSAALATAPTRPPAALLVPIVVYFAVFEGYAAVAILRAIPAARGVTRRRLQLIGLATMLLGLVILVAGIATALPAASILSQPLALVSALSYLLGFAPPSSLRRAWQAPLVFEFVRRVNRLVGEEDAAVVKTALARDTAVALGLGEAAVWIVSAGGQLAHVWPAYAPPFDRKLDAPGRWVALDDQRPAITHDDGRAPGRLPEELRSRGMRYALEAPLTAGDARFGVLAAYSPRYSIFLEEDLALLELLATEAAVVLSQRRLLEKVRGLNRTLERNVSELRALNDELGAFAYSVSHDLRAPLRSIDGFSQILLEDKAAELGDDGRQHLERVRAAATRMGSLIDDMLLLSRLTREEMNPRRVDMTALARIVVEELRGREPQRLVEFESDGALPAKGDERLLRIALTNLLGNSWKFTRERQPAHISFGQETRDGEQVFYVRDDGVGFDMRYASKLFGAFQRLHNTTEFEGSGIGLATVQRIVHRHGGRVWAESEVGKGTSIYFTLPPADPVPAEGIG